jgi:hypothetical protein
MSLRRRISESLNLIPCLLLIVFVFLSLADGLGDGDGMRGLGRAGIARDRMVARLAELGILLGERHGRDAGQLHDPLDPGRAPSYMGTSMAYTGIPLALANWVNSLQLSPYALIAALTVMYIVLGTALDGISMIVLTTAIVIPMVKQAGFDLVWFGIFLVLVVEMAEVSPPGRLQSVRPADHERQGFQHGRQGGPAVLLFARSGGCHHHGLSCYRDGAAADGVPWLEKGIVMFRLIKTCALAACVAALAAPALVVPAAAQTKWNLPAAYPADNPHSVNLIAFAKDVGDATGGKLQITVHAAASLFKAPEIKRAVATGQAQAGEV